jgi:hypothetical protein
MMKKNPNRIFRSNTRRAKSIWGALTKVSLENLKNLSTEHGLSVGSGEIQLIEGRWYITHAGLLRISLLRRCAGIRTSFERSLSDPTIRRWVFRATVYKTPTSKGFVGYGDADPSNTPPLVRGAEMRVAETRAVNRALRKAYGIGLCSVEELGWSSAPFQQRQSNGVKPFHASTNGNHNGQPRLRDQLCVLIRQYNLDPTLVKAYAAHFCGTETLKDASRDLVESFISHLADSAKEDREGLVCKLNSFAQPVEANL